VKKEIISFWIVLIAAFILRLISLNQSFWLDEAVQVWASSHFSLVGLFSKYMPGDFNPPLYHVLLHFWINILGTSEAGVRLFSVILGTACLWLVWKISAELELERRPRLLAVILLATSPLHVYYSQEARMYILASFTFLLVVWRFLVFSKEASWRNSFLFGGSLVLMGFSHFLTLLSLPVFALFSLWQYMTSLKGKKKKKEKRTFLKLFFPYLIFAAAYLLYLPLFLRQLATGSGWVEKFPVWGQTVGSFGLKSVALLPVKFVIGRISMEDKVAYGLVSLALVIIFWGLASLGIVKNAKLKVKSAKLPARIAYAKAFRARQFKIQNWRMFFISCLLLISPALGFLISFWIPVFSYFRFLYVLPLFYLLIIVGLEGLGRLGKFVVVFLVGVNLFCSGVYLFNPKFHREDWRGMVEWLQKRNQNYGAPVLILPQISKPFEYYDRGESDIAYINPSTSENLYESIHRNWRQVYLVSYGLPIFDPAGKIREKLKKVGYEIRKGKSFRRVGVEVWSY
jgi:uncharacterized membrane protein